MCALFSCRPLLAQQPQPASVAQLSQDDPAYKAAFQETLRRPNDPAVLINFANLAVKAGNLEGAISAFERLLLIEADQPKVKLELGVLYYRLGSYEQARAYLEAARSSSRATDDVKERASRFIADVNQATGKSRLTGDILGGIQYSTNANSGPAGSIRSFGASTVPTPNVSGQADFSAIASAAFRHRYDLERQDQGALETDFLLYGAQQFQATQANVTLVDLTTGPRTSPFEGWADDMTIKPYVAGRYIAVGGATSYWAWATGMELTSPVGGTTTGALALFGRRREYVNTASSPTNTNSSGNDIASTMEFRTTISRNLTTVFRGNFTRYIASVASETYTEFGASASLNYRFADPLGLNGRRWLASLTAGVERAAYDQPDPSVDPSVSRQQNDMLLSFVLGIPLTEDLTLVSQTTYARRDANISNYTYDALTTLVGVSWRF